MINLQTWYTFLVRKLMIHIFSHRDSLPSLIAGSEDGIVRVHKCIISDTSKQLSGIEMVRYLHSSKFIMKVMMERYSMYKGNMLLAKNSKIILKTCLKISLEFLVL